MEDLKSGSSSCTTVEEFLLDLKELFGRKDDKMMKLAELRKVEQRSKTIEESIQEFRKVVRRSKYKEWPLIEKFKKGMNKVIRRKLMEVERLPRSIDQWYKHTTNLDRHWRESWKEEERLKRKRD